MESLSFLVEDAMPGALINTPQRTPTGNMGFMTQLYMYKHNYT